MASVTTNRIVMLSSLLNKLRSLPWQRTLSLPVLLVYGITLGIYLANGRATALMDTGPARHLALSLIRDGDLDLSEIRDKLDVLELTYVVKEIDGRIVSTYPVGAAFLAVPYYLVAMLMGLRPDQLDGLSHMDKFASANLGALLAALFWVLLRRRTVAPVWLRLVAWVFFSFGTSNWMVNSQALWQHIPLQICEVLALLAWPWEGSRKKALRIGLCGLMLGLAGFMRPTGFILIPAWGLYILLTNWRAALPYAAGAALGCVPQILYNLVNVPPIKGGYFELIFGNDYFANLTPGWNFTSLLFSPSRGLIIFCPLVALLILWPLRAVRRANLLRLPAALPVISALAIFAIYLVFSIWWQGWCYGARFLTDIMPFLVLLMLAPLHAITQGSKVQRLAGGVVITLGLAWSVGVQTLGAARYDSAWESRVHVSEAAEMAWDWQDNGIADCWRGGVDPRKRPNPPDYYTMEPGRYYRVGARESAQFLWSGFYDQEPWGVWTRGALPAVMMLHLPQGSGTLYLAAMGTGSDYAPARFTIYLNGHRVRKEATMPGNAFYNWKAQVVKIPLKQKEISEGVNRLEIIAHDGGRAQPSGRFYGMGIKEMIYLPDAMGDQATSVTARFQGL